MAMEILVQMKDKFLKFLPRQPVASMAFQIQNPTLSPSRSVAGGGNRTPPRSHIVSIIPKEARRKLRSSSFSAREPTSPKVSCMGEVKGKKKKKKGARKNKASEAKESAAAEKVKKEKTLLWIFKGTYGECESPKESSRSGKALVLELEEKKAPSDTESPVPSLGTMKKFASGRGTLSDFGVKLAQRIFKDLGIQCTEYEELANKTWVALGLTQIGFSQA
ncbi:uncharacterized protein G2W53_020171 [Senna tora]|uniref:Uncharacterized protein n=1 Tax=Senna tora TaxID=362788 RepID=A0A834TVK7_9FABA|nr:uncharacterized protein G2W53_020171 [Senna tora]